MRVGVSRWQFNAEMMPLRRLGGMGWKIREHDFDAETRSRGEKPKARTNAETAEVGLAFGRNGVGFRRDVKKILDELGDERSFRRCDFVSNNIKRTKRVLEGYLIRSLIHRRFAISAEKMVSALNRARV
jgi:hypothetical protein